jgi:hypothetical protein
LPTPAPFDGAPGGAPPGVDLDISFDGWQDAGPGNINWDPIRGGGAQHFNLAMADRAWRDEFIRTMGRMLPYYEPTTTKRRTRMGKRTHPHVLWVNHLRLLVIVDVFFLKS